MKELKCPNCGQVFQVDEADYASIKGLNIKSKEENPLMAILVQAVEKDNAEEDEDDED